MTEPPNALMAINHELRQVEALSIRPLDENDTGLYALISKVRDALGGRWGLRTGTACQAARDAAADFRRASSTTSFCSELTRAAPYCLSRADL